MLRTLAHFALVSDRMALKEAMNFLKLATPWDRLVPIVGNSRRPSG